MPAMQPDEARRRFAAARAARLATITPDGRPHIVPITFAVEGDRIYSVVDTVKPKSSQSLARLRNIEGNPQFSLLVDDYSDDWRQLWWVRADGRAKVRANGAERERAITLLRRRYPLYGPSQEFGSAMIFEVDRWVGWAAATRALPSRS